MGGGGNTLFVHEGPRRTAKKTSNCPFWATKGHGGPRRKPLQGYCLVCPRWAGGNTFFVHEGPRRTAKKTLTSFLSTKGHEGPRRTAKKTLTSFCPRRAAKDREETFAGLLFGLSAMGGGGNTFFVHEGPRRTAKKTFAGLLFGLSAMGCGGGTPFGVDSDYGRRLRESLEKRSDSARRRSQGRGGTAGDSRG